MKKIAFASLLILAGASAQAQAVYGDVAYQLFDTELTTDPAALRATLGFEFTPMLAGEVMLGLNARSGKETVNGIPVTSKLDQLVGVYVKPKFKINQSFELYGRAGFVSSKVSASALGSSVSDSTSGFSYGIGASYYITPALSINVDYMDYDELEGGIAIGVKYSF